MYEIERRAGRGIAAFILFDLERFTSLESYQSQKKDYLAAIQDLIKEDWFVQYSGSTWCHVYPANREVPSSGFKLHVSSNRDSAEDVLRIVAETLISRRTPFKFLIDGTIHHYINSPRCSKSSSGKFITIYPSNNEDFIDLAGILRDITRDFTGPYILSDRRVEGSSVVFYRFGSFISQTKINVFGELVPFMTLPSGENVDDIRVPRFVLPAGIKDPFAQEAPVAKQPLIKGRYAAESCIWTSNKGGVYLCHDTQTGKRVVLKEARKGISDDWHGKGKVDAIDQLKREVEYLRALEGTNVVPKIYDDFLEWENYFVAMEYLEAHNLHFVTAEEAFSLNLKTEPTAEDIRQFYDGFLAIAEKLLAAVYEVHDRGIVIGDLAPQNIIYDPATQFLRLIDFESATYADVPRPQTFFIATPGFNNINDFKVRLPNKADDFDAVGNVLYSLLLPINSLFTLAPEVKFQVITRFVQELGGTEQIIDLLRFVSSDREKNRAMLDAARASLANIRATVALPVKLSPQDLNNISGAIAQGVAKRIEVCAESVRYLPDYRALLTTDLNFSHGLTGIIYLFARSEENLSLELRDWFIAKCLSLKDDELAAGLHNGFAGLAFTLTELGELELAGEMLKKSSSATTFGKSLDLWNGYAGVGLTALKHFRKSRDRASLDLADMCLMKAMADVIEEGEALYFRNVDSTVYHGLMHGASGLALFALKYFEITDDPNHYHFAERLLQFELSHMRELDDAYSWVRSIDSNVTTPYLRVGGAGIIHVLLRFHEKDPAHGYLQVAEKAAKYLMRKYTLSPCLYTGMAGIAECLHEVYLASGKNCYQDEALRFAERCLLLGKRGDESISFAGEDCMRFTDDLATGASGIALAFSRISKCKKDQWIYDV
jgi:serine/threonine protein kinase